MNYYSEVDTKLTHNGNLQGSLYVRCRLESETYSLGDEQY